MRNARLLGVALAMMVLLAACGGGGPSGVARDWLEASATGDGATTLKLTCREYREQMQMMGFLTAGLGLMTGIDTQSAGLDMSDLKFTTTSQSGDSAVVHVEGEMIVSLLGAAMPQYVDSDLWLVKEDGDWVVCGGE